MYDKAFLFSGNKWRSYKLIFREVLIFPVTSGQIVPVKTSKKLNILVVTTSPIGSDT